MKSYEWLRRWAPTALVFIALAAIGYAGHRTGWKIPRLGSAAVVSTKAEDWCATHRVPESKCIACSPALAGADPADWCREHGVPESRCTVCHPEALTKGAAEDWCAEHGVPESGCTICHPDLALRSGPAPARDPAVAPDPEAATSPDPRDCNAHLLRVQFASPASVAKAGIRVEEVAERPIAASVEASAQVEYDGTRLARVASRADGTVRSVERSLGDAVKGGEVLFHVDAPEAGKARLDLLGALGAIEAREAVLRRVEASAGSGLRTAAELEEARALLREARIRLLAAREALASLGLPVRLEDLRGLSEESLAARVSGLGLGQGDPGAGTSTANLLPVASPLDGVVVAREAVAGEPVEAGKPLFTVADVGLMWVTADVGLESASAVALGQEVLFRPDGGGDAVRGEVIWVATAADPRTRTVRVRASVENPDGRLRAGAFGTARIVVREAKAVAVPAEAVQWDGCCSVVFVRESDEAFRVRKVRAGARSGPWIEVMAGVLPGEVVATAGSQVLRSEILRAKLGAGCAD
jgi:cobalt-zinc-cadmium efflux system membrane fusion protein